MHRALLPVALVIFSAGTMVCPPAVYAQQTGAGSPASPSPETYRGSPGIPGTLSPQDDKGSGNGSSSAGSPGYSQQTLPSANQTSGGSPGIGSSPGQSSGGSPGMPAK
jgi:hypothetical protein